MKTMFVAAVIGLLASCIHAASDIPVSQAGFVEAKTDLKTLPAHLKPDDDKFSLLADFQNAKAGRVTLYLVNATKKPTLLPAQDGDVYCKREVRTDEGEWRRCDSHQYSWCGNSYSYVELPAGGVLAWQQKLDSKGGKERPVRFRFFGNALGDLESNEGTATVTDTEIEFCRYDAMAMTFGSFEDVVAVATGEVKGSQGSSLGENIAIPALERFGEEEQLFPVLKKVIAGLLKRQTDEGKARDYESCLRALAKTMGRTVRPLDAWDYVVDQVRDPDFPWSGVALDWLVLHFETRWRETKELTEKILTKPAHHAIGAALHAYAKLAEKDEAGPRLEAISNDKSYGSDVRSVAREVRDELFVNPFLRVSIDLGDPFAEELRSLRSVTIANISPQTISLPVAKIDDLIFVRMVSDNDGGTRMPVSGSGQILLLKPGEKVVLPEVRWWQGLDTAKIKSEQSYSFILHVATPGVWDVPAQAGSWISVNGEMLLGALEKDNP